MLLKIFKWLGLKKKKLILLLRICCRKVLSYCHLPPPAQQVQTVMKWEMMVLLFLIAGAVILAQIMGHHPALTWWQLTLQPFTRSHFLKLAHPLISKLTHARSRIRLVFQVLLLQLMTIHHSVFWLINQCTRYNMVLAQSQWQMCKTTT